LSDWFNTLAAGSELSMDAASELQESGFVVIPGPARADLWAMFTPCRGSGEQ